ncbi:MAG: hypothetical protein DPW16_02280 [Chloroflexi bacterium]|nr:hypothetical protein [Chloroflexota bacterium]MCQ3929260.1 hypothetical protein [Chloroflexota bacterium]GIK66314.1 MAG: hypothetical protein BroJett018_41080 [Chloroflexota bacterium]
MRKVVPLRQMSQAHEDQMIAKPDKTQFPRTVFILIHSSAVNLVVNRKGIYTNSGGRPIGGERL